MLVSEMLDGQPKKPAICETCGSLYFTAASPAAIGECAECMRARLEPKDENNCDNWREDLERIWNNIMRPGQRGGGGAQI